MANIKQNQACALGLAIRSEIQLAERLLLSLWLDTFKIPARPFVFKALPRKKNIKPNGSTNTSTNNQ